MYTRIINCMELYITTYVCNKNGVYAVPLTALYITWNSPQLILIFWCPSFAIYTSRTHNIPCRDFPHSWLEIRETIHSMFDLIYLFN